MRFDLIDLRLFLNVHEAGTITGGAQRSHMTLASASERIRGMEDALGVSLLLRERRGVQLTPAGLTVVHHARLVLRQIDRMRSDMSDFGTGLKGHVRLLSNTSALSEHLPPLLSYFLASHTAISVDLEERSSDEIVDAIRNELGDIGIVSDSADLDGLETFHFCADPLVLVVPREHVLATHSSIGLADILNHAFIGLTTGSALQRHVEHHARRLGRRLNYRIRLSNFESVCRMVGLGVGVGIVPKAVAMRCARTAKIKQIKLTDAWAQRHLVLCVRNMADLPVHVQQMAQHILASVALNDRLPAG